MGCAFLFNRNTYMNAKAKHFIFSFFLTLLFFGGFCLFLPKDLSAFFAATAAFLMGLAKEVIWDLLLKKGLFEWLDLLFNALGVFAGLTFLIIC